MLVDARTHSVSSHIAVKSRAGVRVSCLVHCRRRRRSMSHAPALSRHLFAFGAIALIVGSTRLRAQVSLGSAQSFGVLADSTITNTGATTIRGNIGVWPGSSITGLGTITLAGTAHLGDGVAHQAQTDALRAYNALTGLPFTTNLSGQNLGSRTLTPSVYYFSSSAQLTGALVLDFLGNPSSPFVFQIGSTLTSASGATVTALNGAVTLDANTISNDSSTASSGGSDFGSLGFSGGPSTTVPEPSTVSLLASACGLLFFVIVRRERRLRRTQARHAPIA